MRLQSSKLFTTTARVLPSLRSKARRKLHYLPRLNNLGLDIAKEVHEGSPYLKHGSLVISPPPFAHGSVIVSELEEVSDNRAGIRNLEDALNAGLIC